MIRSSRLADSYGGKLPRHRADCKCAAARCKSKAAPTLPPARLA
jgi:hypothetical protein